MLGAQDCLKDEKIVGSPDVNPTDIEAAMKEAGLTGRTALVRRRTARTVDGHQHRPP